MDERKKIIEYFQKNSVLIQSEAVDFLVERGNVLKNSKKVLEEFDEKPLNILLGDIKKVFDEDDRKEKKAAIPHIEGSSGLEILEDVTGKSSCEGTLSDFTHLFRDRYESLYALLRKRQEMKNLLPLKKAQRREGDVAVIGIVNEIKRGKNGHVLVDIEDESDNATLYIQKDVAGAAAAIVEDEVIGAVGKTGRGGLIITQNIIWPDVPLNKKKRYAEEEAYVAFISDIHIGSKTFLGNEWANFIKWINGNTGNEKQKEVAKKVKYIIMPGDIIEGIGIYPRQEKDLKINDVYGQYKAIAREMEGIPENIKILIQPGNHDAVRPALPQPAFGGEIRDMFSDMNVIFVGNPCYMRMNGVEVLSYHGQSLQDFSTRIGIDQNRPTEIMKSMLQCRHMAPIYGDGTPLAPEKRDYMVIDRVPDIFVTGHVHTTAIDRYRGVLLINASTWQSQTEYQKMMNFSPDPAKVPVVNLSNGHTSLMDFST
ncbi:MAG: DNA-directed DNA polymerase II small subunit [Candidatus Thermoplasmatota archaeon]|nr:DNA-directed DNA polymerase II small subunit [Candidatus Thermoplasmatota archaeon]